MKIRTGYVSNSSSSSFIAAVKTKGEPCDKCGREDPDFLGLLKNYEDGDTELYRLGLEDVVEGHRTSIRDCGYDPDRAWADGLRCANCQGMETMLVQRPDNGLYQVECVQCGARGPAAPKDKAEHVWKRVNTDTSLAEGERDMLNILQTIQTKGVELVEQGYEIVSFRLSHYEHAMEALFNAGKECGTIIVFDSDE